MEKIYIVMGSAGEYSDHITWQVAAYNTEDEAKKHVEKAAERFRELNLEYHEDVYSIPQGENEYDSCMHVDYTGTRYYVKEVNLYHDIVEYRLTI